MRYNAKDDSSVWGYLLTRRLQRVDGPTLASRPLRAVGVLVHVALPRLDGLVVLLLAEANVSDLEPRQLGPLVGQFRGGLLEGRQLRCGGISVREFVRPARQERLVCGDGLVGPAVGLIRLRDPPGRDDGVRAGGVGLAEVPGGLDRALQLLTGGVRQTEGPHEQPVRVGDEAADLIRGFLLVGPFLDQGEQVLGVDA